MSLIILSACSGSGKETLSFAAMDTVMSLTVYGGSGSCESISARAAELDERLSAVDTGSEIYALNRDGHVELSDDTAALVGRSLELCEKLKGRFDITVYPAVREWGFTTGEYKIPSADRLSELADNIGYDRVALDGTEASLPEGVMIDLGAAAKGYLADEAMRILTDSGAGGAVLNLGGTVALYGNKPGESEYSVGIADPEAPAGYFGILRLKKGIVSTSGGYERYFEQGGRRFIHILDPSSAEPVDNGTLSVTAITDEGVYADALSTALFVMGAEGAREYYLAHRDFEYIMLTDDGTLYISEGPADSFTLNDGYDFEIIIVE